MAGRSHPALSETLPRPCTMKASERTQVG